MVTGREYDHRLGRWLNVFGFTAEPFALFEAENEGDKLPVGRDLGIRDPLKGDEVVEGDRPGLLGEGRCSCGSRTEDQGDESDKDP